MAEYATDLGETTGGFWWTDEETIASPFPGALTQIDADGKISQTIMAFDGSRFAARAFDGLAWSDWRYIFGSAPVEESWPPQVVDQWLWNDECDTIAGWVKLSGASFSAVNSELILPSGAVGVRLQKSVSVPSSGDFIIYLKFKYGVAANAYNQISFRNAAGSGVLSISMGYNYVTSAAQMSVLSANVAGSKVVLKNPVNYGDGVNLAIHVDSTFNCVSFYQRTESGWDFLNSTPRPSSIYGLRSVEALNTSGLREMAVDFISIAKPSMVAIGDSTTAGSRGFSPNPSTWSGVDDYASTWMKWAYLYPSIRNNLIVNKGVGGNTSAQIKARVALDVVDTDPQLVFAQTSCNDYHNGITSFSARTQNIQDTVTLSASRGAAVVLVNAIYANSNNGYHPVEPDFNRQWWNDYRNNIFGVDRFIDVMTAVGAPNGYIDPAKCDADGIHPNVSGYSAIGALIAAEFGF